MHQSGAQRPGNQGGQRPQGGGAPHQHNNNGGAPRQQGAPGQRPAGGFSRPGGPRPGGAPRPGGFSGPRPGGFGGPRPSGPRMMQGPRMPRKEEPYNVNDRIRAKEVRIVGDNVENGIYPIAEALRMADELELDLIEISPTAQPPVYSTTRSSSTSRKSARRNRKRKPPR